VISPKAVRVSVLEEAARVESLAVLSGFRRELHGCLTARADALFELTDALLCADGPVRTLVGLALAPEHRRGHGALYDGLNSGRIDIKRLRMSVARLPLPKAAHGRIVLAVDVSPWLRPDAATSPERLFCHVYGRAKSQAQLIPGWPYSLVAALETGRTSWTAVLDAVRLGPADDATAVTAVQLRDVIGRLRSGGQWQHGDEDILAVTDAGYDVTRLAFLLAGLPVEVAGRIRSDRVLYLPVPTRPPGAKPNGRPPPKPGKAGPGRPPGSTNRRPATRHDVGKTTLRPKPSPRHNRKWVKRQAKSVFERPSACPGASQTRSNSCRPCGRRCGPSSPGRSGRTGSWSPRRSC
jgi:hypothetical protein